MNRYVRSGVMAVAVVAAAGLIVAGFYAADSEGGVAIPAEVERIVPSHQALISPQGSVGADLVNTHTGILQIDGTEVPADQLTLVEPLGQVFFTPGASKDIRLFEAGLHSASVVYWDKSESRDDSDSFTWQFRVG